MRRLLLLLGLASLAPAVRAADSRDLANRIEFGYYTGDRGIVSAVVSELGAGRDESPELTYLYALANFRLADLGTDESALSECADAAGRLVAADSGNAEAWILIAACSYRLAAAEPLRALLHGRRAGKALAAALAIDPNNPRALLVAAGTGEDADARLEALDVAAEAFAGETGPFDWGEAEIHMLRARILLDRGDWRDARDAVERALLVAPDYGRALTLRSEMTSAVR